ncbi:MAG: NAD(P)/FAD-dependent oxidoreductase [Chloroflexota bacterium]|nr:NAD(P)/FAD-dependent oxidoreductase [Chloroflexota bacterium]MDE3194491.1 NAD(P)/FAD-dependent oxidoreductase [Chloroflexota bacterium]
MSAARPRVLILGGGFGGLHLVRHLERRLRHGEADVALVDRSNYSLFSPLLYQVATGELPPHAVAYPLRVPLARAGFRFVRSEVEAIDVEARTVRTADGDLPYDLLVIALGSETNDYGIPGVSEHAVSLKWMEDGRRVRHRILSTFESAAIERNAEKRREMLSFVVAGAGPVGVELSASMRDLMDHTLRWIYPTIDFRHEPSITLIDGADRILPAMDARLAGIAARRLERLGVRMLVRTFVSEIGPTYVRTQDGRTLPAHTSVWAGGVRTIPVVARTALAHDDRGRIVADAFFRARGRDDVIAFGDAAHVEQDGKALPQLAQVAVLEAPAVAENVARLLRHEPLLAYRHKRKGDLIALGRTSAAAEFARPVHLVLSGLPAWTVWRTNYLMQLVGARNRGTLLVEWLLSYFSRRIVTDIA